MAKFWPFTVLNQSKQKTKDTLMVPFAYCPLIWMNYSRNLIESMVCMRELFGKSTYDFKSSFHQLLEKDNYATIHQRNQQTLATEILY